MPRQVTATQVTSRLNYSLLPPTPLYCMPYSGSGPAVVAMLSGEVDLMFDSISTSVVHVKDKKLKGLAVSSVNRAAITQISLL
ncbi:hypothetical protein OURE66S_03095 [Oligella ureolytica]